MEGKHVFGREGTRPKELCGGRVLLHRYRMLLQSTLFLEERIKRGGVLHLIRPVQFRG